MIRLVKQDLSPVGGTQSFVCERCREQYPAKIPVCPACGCDEVNPPRAKRSEPEALHISRVPSHEDGLRIHSGVPGLDTVLGGGLVEDSIVLIAGEPGAGKSSLLLAAASQWAEQGFRVLYVAAEEGAPAVKVRAVRLGIDTEAAEEDHPLYLRHTSSLEDIEQTVHRRDIDIVIVDSIQRIATLQVRGHSGSVEQMRACTKRLCDMAKKEVRAVILVGHVTAEGDIAGPMSLLHDVDALLMLGTDDAGRRYLLATKNRYGETGAATWWEMTGRGLIDAGDPSRQLLEQTDREAGIVFLPDASLAKPQLVRIEASVTDAAADLQCRGVEQGRVRHVLRLLRTHCDLDLSGQCLAIEVGTLLGRPCKDQGLDLALAVAVLSAARGASVPWPSLAFGRLSVRGRVEPVDRDYLRLEASSGWRVRSILAPKWTRKCEAVERLVARIPRLDGVQPWLIRI